MNLNNYKRRNKMRKLLILVLAVISAGIAYGQESKEVAVLNPKVIQGDVSANDKLIITSSMKKSFMQIDGYKAYSRQSQALITAEQGFQRSGTVSDEQIKAIGQQTGCAYICTFTLSLEKNELVVNSDIIDVVSGEIVNSDFITLLDRTNRNDVMEQCQSLAFTLLGQSRNSVSSGKPSSNSSSGSQTHPAEPEMIFVQGGTFWMGCSQEQQGSCEDNESPLHRVTVSSFHIGKYEVTQAQWKLIMGSNPSTFKGDNLPVETVSWNDAQEFISRLNAPQANNIVCQLKQNGNTQHGVAAKAVVTNTAVATILIM
jgi:hypothetical protein